MKRTKKTMIMITKKRGAVKKYILIKKNKENLTT